MKSVKGLLEQMSVREPFADPAQQSHLQIDNEFGLTVTHVQKDSAAATAELRKFDVLMEFNGSIW